jgi:hypothetical protein
MAAARYGRSQGLAHLLTVSARTPANKPMDVLFQGAQRWLARPYPVQAPAEFEAVAVASGLRLTGIQWPAVGDQTRTNRVVGRSLTIGGLRTWADDGSAPTNVVPPRIIGGAGVSRSMWFVQVD